MEAVRGEIVIDPTVSVTVNFEVVSGEDGPAVPFFECKGCDVLLRWNSAKAYWVCPECAYELTPPEARMLLEDRRRKLSYLEQYVDRKAGRPARAKKGWWSWLLGLFWRTQQLPAPSSKSSDPD